MRGRNLDLLTGTALALALMLAGPATAAPDENSAAIEALIPVPEPANVPPPTISDIGGQATATVTPKADVVPAIPAAAPAPAAPADATPAAAPNDVATAPAAPLDPVAEKLREVLAGKLDRLIERKNERKPIEAFYTARNYAPLWSDNGAVNARAQAVIAPLRQADSDGLDPSDYPTPDFAAAATPEALADAEIRLTSSVLTYARHAQIGRVHYSRVSADIVYSLVPPEPAEVLAKVAEAKDAGEALASYNPPHEGYRLLREKLAEARGRTGDGGPARIAAGPVLKVGMSDERVPQLRERLGLVAADNTTFDKALSEAVKKFQAGHDLSRTGTLNSATIDSLNGPKRGRDADVIIANMERWRWLPRDLGKAYVMVNIPEYMLKVVNNGSVVWRTRVVVGKPSMPTPLLSETMKYITVNPTWNVPPSIVHNEYLPALQQDPTALERIGLKVEHNRDGTVHIFQPPGAGNALGRIRFNFPNKFLVYQHDTPDKYLFAHDKRAYSHGCMRVQDPAKYAEVLLSIELPHEGYTQERIQRMFGTGEKDISFPKPIPVHLTYQTAYVDDAGKLVIREDIYGRDARVLAELRGSERRYADIAIERAQTTRHQAVRLQRPASGPFSFFGSLFSGGGRDERFQR
ncbi:MAG: L,D-transpeptidase family protein [Hyphomicrobiales bacterium]|nr:L,D-transpeptidase family protein [Hyphomicrobiales bacterium]MBV8827358.1 L,D-transpeptidase family protein [Hyphomicrobiales bacterium]